MSGSKDDQVVLPGGAAEKISVWLAPLLGAVTAIGPLSIDMYLPAFGQIARDLPGPAGAVEFTLVAFLLGAGVSQLFYGPISDRFGRRRPLLIGCLVFSLGALGCALAQSLPWLIAARLVQALGGGAGMVLARAVVRDRCQMKDAARLFAMLMLIVGIAPIVAPWLGGQLLIVGSWRLIFLMLAAFGLVCFAMCGLWLSESLPADRRTGGGARLIAANYWRVLRDPRFGVFALIAGCQTGMIFAYVSSAPVVLIELHGVTPQQFGFFFGINAIGLMIGTQSNRLLLGRFEPRQILTTALTIVSTATLVLLAAVMSDSGGLAGIVIPLFFCLFGVGLGGPNLMALAMAPFARNAGVASALLGMAQFGFGGISSAVIGLIQDGTAWPMAIVMTASAITATAALAAATARAVADADESPTLLPTGLEGEA